MTTLTPAIVFWILIYLGREQLGLKGIIISILIWLGLLVGSSFSGPPYVFIAAHALLDIVLGFIIFGRNMSTRLR